MAASQQLVVLAILGPYVLLWWAALRIVAGRLFQPVEWIPLAILAFLIPIAFLDWFGLDETEGWIAIAAWNTLPVALVLVYLVRRNRVADMWPSLAPSGSERSKT